MSVLWLINQYTSTPETGIAGRHHYLARELAALGHDVTLIGARWHHLLNVDPDHPLPDMERRDGYRFARIRVPRYADAHDRRRVLAWLAFRAGLRGLPSRLGKPDAILYSAPSPIGYPGAERLARRSGARLVFEVRDIWPLTLQEIGGVSPRHPLMRWMQLIEDRAYARADAVVSNLPHAVDHMQTRGMDREKFTWVPNGFSQSEIEAGTALPPETSEALPQGKFIVGYAGTIGEANALDVLVEAAKRLRDRNDIAFAIVGKGRLRDALQAQIARYGLDNVAVLPSVPKSSVQPLLSRFSVCYLGLKSQKLFSFGVSPNKLFDYLLAGKPIVYAIGSGQYRPVEAFGAGVQVPPEDPDAVARAIIDLAARPASELAGMGIRGRESALAQHEYGTLARKLESVLIPGPTC